MTNAPPLPIGVRSADYEGSDFVGPATESSVAAVRQDEGVRWPMSGTSPTLIAIEAAMMPVTDSVDFLEELRLRRWARENYCYGDARQPSWHPIVHDEMRCRDDEGLSSDDIRVLAELDESSSPGDATILTDLPESEVSADVAPAAVALSSIPVSPIISPIVPLMPDLAGLHGPHEISPPHMRIGAPIETREMHYT